MVATRDAAAVLQGLIVATAAEIPLRQVIEALPAAVYTTDAEGRIDLYNRAAVELWGRKPDIRRDRWCGSWRLFYPDGRPMPHDECPMARAMKSGRPIRGEEAIAERPDGSRVTFLAYPTPLRVALGTSVGAVNMLLDITDRKNAEAALRRREAELTDFVENTTIGLHWIGPDGAILWANRAEMDLLGVTPDEYVGRHIREFHADRSAIDDILERLKKSETLKDYEARLRCKDGSIKHVLIDTSVYAENNRFVHTRCFTRDVTGQKRVERRLSTEAEIAQILSEANSADAAAPGILKSLSAYFEADIVELWLGAETLRCVAMYSPLSAKALRKFRKATVGLAVAPNEGLPGRVWQTKAPVWLENVTHASDFLRNQAAAGLGLGTGVGIPLLVGRQCLGVITCFMRRAVSPEPSLLNMMVSIGHRLGQFIEKARREDENRCLAAVVKASTDAIVSASMESVITSWNEGAERLFGYTAEEAIGQSLSLIVPKNRGSERHRNIPKLRRGGIVEPFETIRRKKSGDLIPVSVSLSGISGSGGKLIGTAAILRDISERKASEAQLNGRIRQIQAVSELGMLALASDDHQSLFDRAVAQLARGLDVDFAKLMQFRPVENVLLLRAGVGWREGLVGRATISADRESQAGYTLSVDQPVIVENLKSETRFEHAGILREHEIVSGLSVIIRREGHKPFGVLGAHSKVSRKFTFHDVHFIQSVANILATALQRKSYEERQVILIRELAHRVKNTLAVIQAIARQTGIQATSVDGFISSFEGRLFALAQAHDLLTASNWAGASLTKLVGLVLGIHAEKKRLYLDLEEIKLSSTGTQAMVMVFHELMTNAAKYGAHSNDKGRVMLEGHREKNGDEMVYSMTWREIDGPTVTAPTRRGFGSELVTATVQMQCSGTLSVDWRPEGLVVKCTLPLSSIAEVEDASSKLLKIKW